MTTSTTTLTIQSKNTKYISNAPNTLWIVFFFLECMSFISMQTDQLYVTNLTPQCMRCLCFAATNCDLTAGCKAGYCGPYKISRVYWIDAGRLVMPEDDPERAGAFEDCALSYICAQRLVKNYMAKYGRDCNDDGVTDCGDFSMINFNGGLQCSPSLDRNEYGRNWTTRYTLCSPAV